MSCFKDAPVKRPIIIGYVEESRPGEPLFAISLVALRYHDFQSAISLAGLRYHNIHSAILLVGLN